jgi:hypothetical protein
MFRERGKTKHDRSQQRLTPRPALTPVAAAISMSAAISE